MLKLQNVNYGDKLIVALSGGKDSMCLIHCLTSVKNTLNLSIAAVNVDHNIRGEESRSDSSFVKNYCEKQGIPLYFKSVDAVKYSKENGMSLENAARVLRYKVFDEALLKYKGYKIATAHHKNDQFESVLFNIFRGTGIKGLKGIEDVNTKLVRPLLNCSRKDIDEYASENNIPYVVDSTNFDTDYSRNYIRNEIIPIILNKFPFAIDNVYNLSKTVKEDDDFIENSAEKLVFLYNGNYAIPLNEHPALLKRAIIIALKKSGLTKDYEKSHVDGVYSLLNLENGSEITLPKNITAIKSYDKIVFYKNLPLKKDVAYPFSVSKFKFNNVTAIIKPSDFNIGNGNIIFDADKIPKTSQVRLRKNGDVFTKFGGGTKKLKDYFIDKKIPVKERDFIPVIANGNEILVIFGVEISDKVKITPQTKNILQGLLK